MGGGERSSSQYTIEMVKGSHEFAIEGYSLVKGIGVGEHLRSRKFMAGGYEWEIYFYPDGKIIETQGCHVSVFVALASHATDVRALFQLVLIDQTGRGRHKVNSHFNGNLPNGPFTLKRLGSKWGFKRYFDRTRLDNSRFLKNDSLKIHCTVGVVLSPTEFSRLNPIQVPESDLEAHFGVLLENEESSDVTFLVGGEKFYAHKIILAARSATFRSELFNGKVVKDAVNREIVVPDIEPEIFKALLHFIYRDTLVEDGELLVSRSELLSFESFPAKLLAAAEKYSLPRLKLMCESELCKHLSIDTVAFMMALADRCRATQLKSICLNFCAENHIVTPPSSGFFSISFSVLYIVNKMKEKSEVEDEEGREARGEEKGNDNLNEEHGFGGGFGGSIVVEEGLRDKGERRENDFLKK
ncbi:hypothetical protein Fmac_029478 [Flemingia macrophylla]|uniref:BTB/POZ and MATH domain-containing protein 4 n=1 Tax=Flemingia macrophylla TaxID=520843 RepID=A0ABD1LAG8_9FABA